MERDDVGRIVGSALPGSRELEATYDDVGNLVSLTPPGKSAHTFGFTPVNLPEETTAPALTASPTTPRITTTSWDLERKAIAIEKPSGDTVTLVRDAGGRVTTTI